MLILKVLLGLLSLKWRNLTNTFLYLQIVYQMIVSFLPATHSIDGDQWQLISLRLHTRCTQVFLLYYTDSAV